VGEKSKQKRVAWPGLLKRIKHHKGWQKSVPSDDRLQHFGGLVGIYLPATYRQFTKRLGAGQLSGWCEFYSCAAGVSERWDMYLWNQSYLRLVLEGDQMADQRARRLVIFGRLWSGDEYGWDTAEVTRKRKQPEEYAIYTVSRLLDRTTKIADTFPEFVADFCTGDGLLSYAGLGREGEPFEYDRYDYAPRG
jgi:hypothetical protein